MLTFPGPLDVQSRHLMLRIKFEAFGCLLAQNLDAADLRRRRLIDRVLADFDHLLDKPRHDWGDPS